MLAAKTCSVWIAAKTLNCMLRESVAAAVKHLPDAGTCIPSEKHRSGFNFTCACAIRLFEENLVHLRFEPTVFVLHNVSIYSLKESYLLNLTV